MIRVDMNSFATVQERRGITLTEILISILIMGIGLLSLATLFPLGLLRLRDANRSSRSALLAASAGSDLVATSLLSKPVYNSLYGYDPFVFDPPGLGSFVGRGMTVCIDPFWWSELERQGVLRTPPVPQTRFASSFDQNNLAQGFIRLDPDGQRASAHGLPRISPFVPLASREALTRLFSSIDDLVYQSEGPSNPGSGFGSTLVPSMDFSPLNANPPQGPQPFVDISYTWMFTGRQTDVGNGLTFDGDIVILHNRPFAIDPAPGVLAATTVLRPANEVVVEAVWGYGPPIAPPTSPPRPTRAYGTNDTTVLLRWPVHQTDPDVRTGSWIADVTYERDAGIAYGNPVNEGDARYDFWNSFPAQRCNWYRVVRKTDPVLENGNAYKRMTLTIDRPVRAKTPVTTNAQNEIVPVVVEAALVSPNVVMVYPKVLVAQ